VVATAYPAGVSRSDDNALAPIAAENRDWYRVCDPTGWDAAFRRMSETPGLGATTATEFKTAALNHSAILP
jgi:hypothetical protein